MTDNDMKKQTTKNVSEKITTADLVRYGREQSSLKSEAIELSEFLKIEGETFGGANFLQLPVGGAAGPFTLAKIERDVKLSDKIAGTTDRYTATTADGMEIGMPVSRSFVDKAVRANLAVGDVFYVARGEDYTSSHGREDCHSYILKITARRKK